MGREIDNHSRNEQRRMIADALNQIEKVETTALGLRHETSRFHGAASVAQTPLEHLPGYEIQEEIHRGGQGVVYRATQVSTSQTVAIKVMLGGAFAGAHQIARFEREIRVLATLEHPNIVTIHDSGVEKGVAYYVMDYIEGQPLDAYLRSSPATRREKLALFISICDAVNAAHLRGVIHRDLKPNNILVDAHGHARILDFGLAKPTGDPELSASTMTETGQFVGSAPWASPEQALGQPDKVDLRTDVYSLGVILYQLLSGDFPYRVKGRLGDVIQAIVHDEPRALPREVDTDIATVAFKALQKEPPRRYQSAGALGQDVSRYLAGDPIDARRSSVLYVLSRKVKRHKWVAVLAATLLFSLLAGAAVSTTLWQLAERRADETLQQAEKAQAVTDFLSDMMLAGNIYSEGTAETTVREVVERAEKKLNDGVLSLQPETEKSLRIIIGQTYDSLGLTGRARTQFEKARSLIPAGTESQTKDALLVQLLIADSVSNEGRSSEAKQMLESTLSTLHKKFQGEHEMIARASISLGETECDLGNFEKATGYLNEALQILRTECNDEGMEALALSELSSNFAAAKQFSEAVEHQEEAVKVLTRAVGANDFRTAIMISGLGDRYTSLERFDEALEQYESALRIMRDIGGDEHPSVGSCLNSLGQMYRTQGKLDLAIDALSRSLHIQQKVLPAGSMRIAYARSNLATCYFDSGQMNQALTMFYKSLETIREIRGEDHPEIAKMLTNISAIEFTNGNYAAAIKLLREAHEIVVNIWGDDHINTAQEKHNLAKTLMDAGQLEEADSLIRQALRLRRDHFGELSLQVAATQDLLAAMLQKRGELKEAESVYRKSLDTRVELNDSSSSIALAYNNLAHIFSDLEKETEAFELADQAYEMIKAALPTGHWRIAQIRANRAVLMARLENYSQAEMELMDAIAALKKQFGRAHPIVVEYEKQLATIYDKTDQRDLADKLRIAE